MEVIEGTAVQFESCVGMNWCFWHKGRNEKCLGPLGSFCCKNNTKIISVVTFNFQSPAFRIAVCSSEVMLHIVCRLQLLPHWGYICSVLIFFTPLRTCTRYHMDTGLDSAVIKQLSLVRNGQDICQLFSFICVIVEGLYTLQSSTAPLHTLAHMINASIYF